MHRALAYIALGLLAVGGCYKPLELSIPRILLPSETWKLDVRCASQGCVEKADLLVGEGIEVEIGPYNRGLSGTKPFLISLRFKMAQNVRLILDPSRSCLKMASNKVICARAARNVSLHSSGGNSFIKAEYVVGAVELPDDSVASEHKRRSIALLFDVPAPEVEEQFSLILDGLVKDGKPLELPTLIFSLGKR